MDIDNLLRGFREGTQEGGETSEDRTLYIRDTPNGARVDFEVVEKTSFSKSFPETTKELHSKGPLSCGHPASQQNPFGGYCASKVGLIRKKKCGKEYCSLCAVRCRCGIFVSACCAKQFGGILYCKSCRRKLRAKKALAILLHPFITEGLPDD